MVAAVEADTGVVVTVKVAVVLPAATVTLAGTTADELLVDKLTEAPPVGAAALRVTVPVEELPPVTLLGLSETEFNAPVAGPTVSPAVLLTLL